MPNFAFTLPMTVAMPAGFWASMSMRPPTLSTAIFTALLMVVGLAGCSGDRRDKAATQVAAKVNKEEVSVHQVNFHLQRQPGLVPEQMEGARRRVLERLIDEELAVQKAEELRLDRDPKVMQAIDAARREILARSYHDKIGESAARPGSDEVRKYYDSNPALFKERRIYTLQEIAIESDTRQLEEIRAQLQVAQTSAQFADWLKAKGLRFVVNQAVRPAEQLPLATLPALAKLKDGQAMLIPGASGAQVMVVLASRLAPVEESKARPVIEQFLWNENKRRMVQGDMKALRDASRIEYVGKFADVGKADAGVAASPPAGPAASAER